MLITLLIDVEITSIELGLKLKLEESKIKLAIESKAKTSV